jgi:hypothetical protein
MICGGASNTKTYININIPSSIEYEGVTYTVTQISTYAFYDYTIRTVTIPSTIEKIYDGAFGKCVNITQLVIPSSVTYIGLGAFANCTSLTRVEFEASEHPIEYGYDTNYPYSGMFENDPISSLYLGREIVYKSASNTGISPFYNQTEMRSVSFSDDLTTIGLHLFDGCIALRDITLPANLEKIEDYAFNGCNLRNLTINSKLQTIGRAAFGTIENINIPSIQAWTNISINDGFKPLSSTTTLTLNDSIVSEVNVPYGCTRISANAFANYSYLKSVNLPVTVESIGQCAFQSCSALASINIELIKDIGAKAFYEDYNMKLRSENLNTMHIGQYAFYGCVGLSNLQFIADSLTLEKYAFKYCLGLQSFKSTAIIDTIPYHCFERCSGLSNLSLPNTISVIEEGAFYECWSLSEFIGWKNLSKIGSQAFAFSSLSNVVLEGTNLTVEKEAFYHCSDIRTIQINSGVKSIGDEAFNQTLLLESVQFKEGIESIGSNAFPSGISLLGNNATKGVLKFPNSLKKIGDNAFFGSNDVSEIVFGDNLISYGSGNFSTSPIKKVTFNSDVNITEPFNSSVTRVIGCNVSKITKNMLSYWTDLSELVLSKNVLAIESNAFEGCDNFHKFNVPYGDNPLSLPAGFFTNLSLDSITINRQIVDATERYFQNLSTLKYLDLSYAGIQKIPNNAFAGCSNLQNLIVSRNTVSIGEYAFEECSNLESICLPGGISQYDDYLFSGCSRLSTIILLSNANISVKALTGLRKKVTLISRNPSLYNGYSCNDLVTSSQLNLPESYVVLNIGEQTKTSLYDGLIPNAYFDWSSSNVNIVTVDNQGLISAVGTGKSVVQYRCLSDNLCSINVYSNLGALPTNISIQPNTIQGHVGDKIQLSIKTEPEDALKEDIEYSILNQDIASISDDQVVTLKAVGQTKIKAKTVNGLSAIRNIEVYELPTEVSIKPKSNTINEGDVADFVITIKPTTANKLYNIVGITDNGTVLESPQIQITANDSAEVCNLTIDNLIPGDHVISVITRNNLEGSCSISVSNSSGLNDVEQSSPFKFVGNVIYLNTYIHTQVYNISGIKVYDGYDTAIPLQQGYYLVIIGSDIYKIRI